MSDFLINKKTVGNNEFSSLKEASGSGSGSGGSSDVLKLYLFQISEITDDVDTSYYQLYKTLPTSFDDEDTLNPLDGEIASVSEIYSAMVYDFKRIIIADMIRRSRYDEETGTMINYTACLYYYDVNYVSELNGSSLNMTMLRTTYHPRDYVSYASILQLSSFTSEDDAVRWNLSSYSLQTS